MLILPLDHPEPFAATLGVMLYPDPAEAGARATFAARVVAKAITHAGAQERVVQLVGAEDLARLFLATAGPADDLDRRLWDGSATGELFKIYFALAHSEPQLASWENAIKIAMETTASMKPRVVGVRSSFLRAKKKFATAAHLWAAWSIRDRAFTAAPEVGYDGAADFQSFLAEAEILRSWGQSFRPARSKASPPLPAEVWRAPDGWNPPPRGVGCPETGIVPPLTIPDQFLADLRRSGRPKKTS